jgi:hypothetical protein
MTTAKVHGKCRRYNTQRSECATGGRKDFWEDGCLSFAPNELCTQMNICPVHLKRGERYCLPECSIKVSLEWTKDSERFHDKPIGCDFFPDEEYEE